MNLFLNKNLQNLTAYTPGEQPKNGIKLIKLNTNESPFPPSKKVVSAINEQAVENLRLYSDPECTELIQAASCFYGLNPQNITVGNGSDELLAFIFHAFCENGAIFADITYGFYKVFADVYNVKKTIVPLDSDFKIYINDYKNLDGTVFIANPNAPTGIMLTLNKIEELLTQNTNRLIVIDEAYIDFGGESAAKLIEKYNNLIVTQTFSKSRSLAGGRLGIMLSNKDIIADVNKIRYSFNPYNVNSLTQKAGIAALNDVEYFNECCQRIIANRDILTKSYRNLGFEVLESKTNFIFTGKNKKIPAFELYTDLRKNGILTRYFASERTCDFLRITIGNEQEIEQLIKTTEDILNAKN